MELSAVSTPRGHPVRCKDTGIATLPEGFAEDTIPMRGEYPATDYEVTVKGVGRALFATWDPDVDGTTLANSSNM